MDATRTARCALAFLAASALIVACGEDSETSAPTSVPPAAAAPKAVEATSKLTSADGAQAGTVTFTTVPEGTEVDIQVTANKAVAAGQFHGIHVHANGDPANGDGCKADPAAAPATWFTAVDGHFTEGTASHTEHKGDLPSVLVRKDGRASLRFTTDRFIPSDLVGKAVVLHASADNFGNIPTGSLPDQYKANGPAASTKTAATGNAGDRMACGVIASP